MPRGQKTFIFMLFLQTLVGCATFNSSETAALRVVEADAPKRALVRDTADFAVFVQAPEMVHEGELMPVRVQTNQDAYLIICQEGYERPLYPVLAFPTEWVDTPKRVWHPRLPWVLTQHVKSIVVFAFRDFVDFDAVHFGMKKGELSCPALMYDYKAMFNEGMVARTVVTVRVIQ